MTLRESPPPLMLITDGAYADGVILAVVASAARAMGRGRLVVQLRDKKRDAASMALFASRLRERTWEVGAALVVNGDARLAAEIRADGVHLGGGAKSVAEARSIAGAATWVSVAAHTNADVERARREQADAVLVSPIFGTSGKGPARGEAALRAAHVLGGDGIAVYALGGVTRQRVRLCRQAGADGVAVIRAVFGAADPAAEARAFADELAPPPA